MYDVLRYRVMNVDAWMLMNEWWMLMNEWWMLWMNEWCMLMDEWWTNMSVDACWWMWDVCWMMNWCVMHWCVLNRLMCVKCMYIFCNHNCILYWFCNCFNVLILIFVFVCLSGFLYLVSCTCNKTVTPYNGVCLRTTYTRTRNIWRPMSFSDVADAWYNGMAGSAYHGGWGLMQHVWSAVAARRRTGSGINELNGNWF